MQLYKFNAATCGLFFVSCTLHACVLVTASHLHTRALLCQRSPAVSCCHGSMSLQPGKCARELTSMFAPQITWERVREGRPGRSGTPYEILEGTFRCATPVSVCISTARSRMAVSSLDK